MTIFIKAADQGGTTYARDVVGAVWLATAMLAFNLHQRRGLKTAADASFAQTVISVTYRFMPPITELDCDRYSAECVVGNEP